MEKCLHVSFPVLTELAGVAIITSACAKAQTPTRCVVILTSNSVVPTPKAFANFSLGLRFGNPKNIDDL